MSIRFEHVSYEYSPNTPFAYVALKDINLELSLGKVTAIIGETGSGKSTLVQHLNALLIPSEGEVEVLGKKLYSHQKNVHLKELRQQVGLVFQFPEAQLFEETIERDIGFGPRNFGVEPEEVKRRVSAALAMVGLDDSYLELSPFELSGGQRRRVAIAGILAIDPDILVLDEPTAGLDPQGSAQMMELFRDLNVKHGKTILIVTHNMEQVLTFADEVVVMDGGQVILKSGTLDFFANEDLLKRLDIVPPLVVSFKRQLQARGIELSPTLFDVDELVAQALTGGHHE